MNDLKIGDIVSSSKTNHPIIYIEDYSTDFVGCLITHSSTEKFKDNIGLRKTDFIIEKGFTVFYDESYFVSSKTIKKEEWGPFKKVGQITKDGIEMIKSYIEDKEAKLWEEYKKSSSA